jgi:alanyl-tRNA synthetase
VQGKAALVVSASPGLGSVDAGTIVRFAAREFGGGGGGTPQLGRGGGGDPAKLAEAVAAARAAVMSGLSG